MELLLIRHAAAEPTPPGSRDAARALTPAGRAHFERIVDGLRHLDLRIDRALHSPLLRAVQTADLLLPLLDGETEVTPWLASPPAEALLKLIQNAPAGRTALIGHEPHLSTLAAWLVLGGAAHDALSQSSVFGLEKGGALQLSGDLRPSAATLNGFFSPRLLEQLAR